jgi:hypothetical protein
VIGLPLAVHSEDRPHFRAGEALSGDHSWMALTFTAGSFPVL